MIHLFRTQEQRTLLSVGLILKKKFRTNRSPLSLFLRGIFHVFNFIATYLSLLHFAPMNRGQSTLWVLGTQRRQWISFSLKQ